MDESKVIKGAGKILRREKILSLYEEGGYISTDALARYFNVSAHTIRRDLNVLVQQKNIKRYHGGATHLNFLQQNATNKMHLVNQVLSSIFGGCYIYIDSGYIAEMLTASLPDVDINIITGNINLYHLVKNERNVRLFFLGGCLGRGGGGYDFFLKFFPQEIFHAINIAVVEVEYIDYEGTALSNSMSKAVVNRLALENAECRYLIRNKNSKIEISQCIYKVYSVDESDYILEVSL